MKKDMFEDAEASCKKGQTTVIRLATAEDEKEVYALITELEEIALPQNEFSDIFSENLISERTVYLVAEENGRLIGFASVHFQKLLHHAANVAELQELVVTSGKRSKGTGKKLFSAVEEAAWERGSTQLEVCCGKKRISSHAFYENRGMERTSYKFLKRL